MITGHVNSEREILISLELLSGEDSHVSIQASVDTGFNGFLTLPPHVLNIIVALPAGTRRAELGDGSLVEIEVFLVQADWDGKALPVLAIQTEASPLVGMSLLWGSRVRFEAEEDGSVMIETIT